MLDAPRWQSRLETLAEKYGVPGAQLAVLHDETVSEFATGVLNAQTGAEASTDSLFQIGSITKLYTATMLMQLVEDRRLDLDQPVHSLLPELRLGDPEATRAVTLRHLLTHTSGIEGDFFRDTTDGDDALARYVTACDDLGFVHPVGATMSYCNTGYVLAGRVIEKIDERCWDDALRARILDPLGLDHTMTPARAGDDLSLAHGHRTSEGVTRPTATWGLPRSVGPAGLICATAGDVVAFARMHLDGGVSPAGTRLLRADTASRMQEPQVAIPNPWTLAGHWGLGWIVFDWDGRRIYGHDGNAVGQSARLRIVPDCGTILVLITNGGDGPELYQTMFGELLADLCHLRMPNRLRPTGAGDRASSASALTGCYERAGCRIEIADDGGHLSGTMTATGDLAALDEDPVAHLEVHALSDSLFLLRDDIDRTWFPAVLYQLPDGSQYVHTQLRATPKTSSPADVPTSHRRTP
jgi:CubicO group peptidase (beta-lactamase class C family)